MAGLTGCNGLGLGNPFKPHGAAINNPFAGREQIDNAIHDADELLRRVDVHGAKIVQRKFPTGFANGDA